MAVTCASREAETVDFRRDIEPIFQRNCYQCHSGAGAEGRLSLDFRESAFESGPSGFRLVPGNPDRSELFRRVAGRSSGDRMPKGGQLGEGSVDLIRRWIAEGAVWPVQAPLREPQRADWAYVPPERPSPPPVGRVTWPRTVVDSFVLSRIESAGIEPSPAAGREALLRRLTLDLTGLPPTIADVDAFLADESPQSYERQVNRLLASPAYGEHWGRIWLDAARHADSNGYEKDKPREVWPYRDWVVGALNDDMGYDRFVIEQVAGDLLPGAGQSQRVATGFLRNSMTNEEGGADPEQFRMEGLFDRMDAIGKAIVGLTIQCAQCHDHKYDPISQREYYRMLAMLNDSFDSTLAVYSPAERRARDRILADIRRIEQRLVHETPDWRERMASWEEQVSGGQTGWTVLDAFVRLGSGEKYSVLPDKSVLAQGFAPTQATVSPMARLDPGTIRAVRLELLTDPRLPLGGPGRSPTGTAALSEVTIEVSSGSLPHEWKPVAIQGATADFEAPNRVQDPRAFPAPGRPPRKLGGIGYALDGEELTAWHTDVGPGRRNVPRKAVFRLAKPLDAQGTSWLRVNLVMKHGGSNTDADHSLNLGRFRLSVTDNPRAVADPLPAAVRHIVAHVPRGSRTSAQEAEVFRFWRSTVPSWREANARVEALWARHPEGATQLVTATTGEPRMTHVLNRGDFLRAGEAVLPGGPASLHHMDVTARQAGRLEFARWLADRRSPTTARAIVNRIWQGHFGTGLVESAEDLGTRSSELSHPALLDWLAVELMESSWSLKHVHRTIVLSQTYRQSAAVSRRMLEQDPQNRLIARASRFRVDAEVVRDVVLAASGLLVRDAGGPPVHPPAPESLFRPPASYAEKRWPPQIARRDNFRRSLYTFRYRSVPYPVFETFDAPSGKLACVRRDRSTTPLQALVTLNAPTFLEAARNLARLAWAQSGPGDAERVDFVFRSVLSRRPTRAERAELASLLRGLRSHFDSRRGRDQAESFIGAALDFRAVSARASELAAWTGLARVVLNLDEAITRQ